MNDSTPSQCPRCGASLPANAPEGLCPRCLAALPFGTETAFTAEPKRPAQPPLFPEQLAPHFPQLEILECLGRGGMGVVYKARQKSLNRLVALKLLAPERADDPQFATRFEKEAQALAALNHPNIVGVHDFGRAGGFYYLLMEFVDGLNLRQLLQSRRLTPKEALGIVPPVCEALEFAHEHGIVHRDIKPENLLLDKAGRVKIADFGIAKIIAASPAEPGVEGKGASAGTATLAVGTPAYAAPEQREANGEADHRADIYSLGVVLYEMLTGERPQKKFELPSRRVQVDVRIDDIVLRALQDTPERRYQTAAEFRTQVETIARGTSATGGETAEALALQAVQAWLALMDGGEYAASWDTASAWFRGVLTKEKWIAEAERVRPPLGDLLSREILGSDFTAGGSRFQARFKTAFAGMPETVETVNFMREREGAWKATGYLIRPADYEESRHARLAAIGAWWALLFPISFVLVYLLRSQWMGGPKPVFLMLLLAPFIIAGWAAPFATTILGWVATTRIRRSSGRRQGLWLAVFDGLVFPLLALDAAIGAFWFVVAKFLVVWITSQGWQTVDARGLDQVLIAGLVLITLVTTILVDWSIVRRVWLAVNRRPDAPASPPPTATSDTPLGTVAFSFAWLSGILAGLAWMRMPNPPGFLVSSILITALAGLALAIPARQSPRGKWSLWFCASSVLVWVFVWRVFAGDLLWRASEPPSYGPVTECVITDALNIETGAMTPLPLPQPLGERDQKRYDWFNAAPSKESAFPWMRQHGIDIIDLGNHGLSGIDMFLVTLEPKDWENLTKADLEKKMNWQWQGIETPPPDVNFPAANGVYGFKTRSGTWGIIKLLSFDLPRGVKVRYKLVVPEPVFNPVVERTISVGNDAHSFYSFDREDYVPGPRDFDPTDKKNEDRFWKWLTANGVDLFARLRNGHPVLFTSEALRWALDEEDFDRLTPQKLAASEGWRTTLNAQFRGQEASTLDRGRLHGSRDTFIFQNRHEISGLIQVAGVTTDPDGVKVRYRLVPRDSVTHAATSPAPASTELDSPSKGQTNISDLSSFYFKHAAADVHYLLFYPHEFGVQDRSSFNTHSLAWLDDGTITLKSGKTLAYLRESVDPLHLRLNGKEFDLRNGRVFLLRDDATVEQHDIPMPLATAQSPDRVAKLLKAALRLDAKSVSSAAPELRFLAWQEKAREPWAHAWHPDGSPVISPTEIALLKERGILPPGMGDRPDKQGRMVRFLHLWFSHPNFERTSFRDVAFFDEDGKPVQGTDGSFGSTADEATPETDNLGWVSFSSSPGADADIPARVTVRLRYTVGPLENTQEVKPNFNGGMSLEGGSALSGLGQNAEGRAFVTVAVDTVQSHGRKFGAQAVTRDGRCLNTAGGSSVGGTLGVENFQFPVPLADVATFIVGTRPIRTQEWKDVVLVKPSEAPAATPMPK